MLITESDLDFHLQIFKCLKQFLACCLILESQYLLYNQMNNQLQTSQPMRSYLERMRHEAIRFSPIRQQQFTASNLFRIRSFSRCEERSSFLQTSSQIFSEKKDLLPVFKRSFLSKKKLLNKDYKDRRTPQVVNKLKIQSVHFSSRDKLNLSRYRQQYSQLLPERKSQQIKKKQNFSMKKVSTDSKLKTEKIVKKRKYFVDEENKNEELSMNLEPW